MPNGARPALFIPKRRDSPATEGVKRDVTRLDLWGSTYGPETRGVKRDATRLDFGGLIWEPHSFSGPIWGSTYVLRPGMSNGTPPPGLLGAHLGAPLPCRAHLGVHPRVHQTGCTPRVAVPKQRPCDQHVHAPRHAPSDHRCAGKLKSASFAFKLSRSKEATQAHSEGRPSARLENPHKYRIRLW